MDARQNMLTAFDRLFLKTADKLQVPYTDEERSQAKAQFADRMAKVLDVLDELPVEAVSPEMLETMESSIDELTPAEVVAQMASLPLMQHTQFLLQRIAHDQAQQRFLLTALDHADTTYGGN